MLTPNDDGEGDVDWDIMERSLKSNGISYGHDEASAMNEEDFMGIQEGRKENPGPPETMDYGWSL